MSCVASDSNLLGAVTKGSFVKSATDFAALTAKSGWEFNPVPTAVPPKASSYKRGKVSFMRSISLRICCAYPENSWPSVRGTASMKCVLPILTIESNSKVFLSRVLNKFSNAGIKR